MNWIQNLSTALDYIENNLTNEISIDEVASKAYSSSSHFQLVFHVVIGITVNEYIRNRRLSLAAQDLMQPNNKIIDVAMRYQYGTQESFSKAFSRFHGVSPSRLQSGDAKVFNPLTINLTIQGGFDMAWKLSDAFHLVDWSEIENQQELSAADKYKKIVSWAGQARATNPSVFDSLTEWILTDSEWTEDKLVENEQILIQGVFARFKEQNARLRAYLKELKPADIVNEPVFKALDDFDMLLSGKPSQGDGRLNDTVINMFADFSTMQNNNVREQIAGGKTGRHGTDSVEIFGFINHLKSCDAQVQWCLFMPDVVKYQQQEFSVTSFEYKHVPAVRFIGKECKNAGEVMPTLDTLREYDSEINHDILFSHHYGKGVDVEPNHDFYGRFMKADTPVPDGFIHFDFTHDYVGGAGFPFQSKFALATFAGDVDAMHKSEGYDAYAMYDVTRNIILGQGIGIPYPEKYWHAEVFLNGYDKPSTAYMFSVVFD